MAPSPMLSALHPGAEAYNDVLVSADLIARR